MFGCDRSTPGIVGNDSQPDVGQQQHFDLLLPELTHELTQRLGRELDRAKLTGCDVLHIDRHRQTDGVGSQLLGELAGGGDLRGGPGDRLESGLRPPLSPGRLAGQNMGLIVFNFGLRVLQTSQ